MRNKKFIVFESIVILYLTLASTYLIKGKPGNPSTTKILFNFFSFKNFLFFMDFKEGGNLNVIFYGIYLKFANKKLVILLTL